jgi:thiamine pyrophosphate-dependent acetolactate synthase large subunit-like protein
MRRPIASPEPFDVVLLAETSRLTLARGPSPLIPTDAKIVELGIREDHLARGYPADVLIYAHPEATLQSLRDALESRTIDPATVQRRATNGAALKREQTDAKRNALETRWNDDPIAPPRLAAELDRAIASDAT